MKKHWIWLWQRKGIGCVGCKKLLSIFHSAERIYELDRQQLLKEGKPALGRIAIDSLFDKDLTEAERIAEECNRLNISIITYNDPSYPNRLKEIHDPPCVLYVKGTLPKIDEEACIGVVGTRKCSNYGLLITKQLSNLIALSGGVVVSGGARGIDTMALNGALDSVMPVICVLAGGLDSYYPAENAGLFEYITQHGCLISEFPPGEKPVPRNFVGRNRIITGLSLAVLVVEAPAKSGALTTAALALDQNRDVYTVYRADGGRHCEGNRELINAGCEVVQDGWDLLSRYAHLFPERVIDGRTREAANILYSHRYGDFFSVYSPLAEIQRANQRGRLRQSMQSRSSEGKMSDTRKDCAIESQESKPPVLLDDEEDMQDLPETEQKVLSVIGRAPVEIDTIIMQTGMASTAVSTALTMLQIKKRIIKCFGNSYQRL
ncbi:MAG: DNA-processing protein DprA [Oscillospiraceae bacterium]|nr:DNA-processing protein DprA [Oscillospiraceae bacterium]